MTRALQIAILAGAALRTLCAGPVEFGLEELQKAIAASKVPAARARVTAEVWPGTKADSFEIVPWRVSGGDLRGLMYGLLEAAEQIQKTGKLIAVRAEPAAAVRGVRITLSGADWEKTALHSRAFWIEYFARLARARFNRFHLILGEPAWHSPAIPYFFTLPFFERVEVEGLTPFERGRNLDALKMIAQTASEYAIDVTLGLKLGPTGAAVKNLTDDFRGPYLRAALPQLLEEVPWIRAVALHECDEELLRESVIPALQSAGRLVTLEIPEQRPLVSREMGTAVRLLSLMPPGVPVPDLSTLRPSQLPVIRMVSGSRYVDPQFVRRVASGVTLGSALGFEVEGAMDLESVETQLFYAAWGRLGFDPKSTILLEQTETAAAIACAARVREPALPLAVLQDCAVKLDRSEDKDLKKLGQRAGVRVRVQWAKTMEEYYAATRHESALRAAYYSYRAAARIDADVQPEVVRLESQVSQLDPEREFTAMPWTVPPRRPAFLHIAAATSRTGLPLQIVAGIPVNSGVTMVKLHYRLIGGSQGYQTLEANPKLPRFTIAASQLATPGQFIYWFEFVHPQATWRFPDERADLPVFLTVLRAPSPLEEIAEAEAAAAKPVTDGGQKTPVPQALPPKKTVP